MNNYRYTLEPYSGMKTRYSCPNCNKKSVFTKYIDAQTSKHLHGSVGCCNRVLKCGYHYKPKQYFKDNNITFDKSQINNYTKPKPRPELKPSFIDFEIMKKSNSRNTCNYFIDFLTNLWDLEIAYYLADKYNIGTSKHWKGATVFWQVDAEKGIRSGKIMLYNPETGKRIKEPYDHVNWVHAVLNLYPFNLKQCYFGEHLLKEDTNKPVALVESEKTAVVCSIYLPEFIWLAVGSVNNLNESKTKCLAGRNVVLFPDLKCFDLWNDKISRLTKLARFSISTLLKDKATKKERDQGLDIADYLIKIPNKIEN
jgi:hypothetical protein